MIAQKRPNPTRVSLSHHASDDTVYFPPCQAVCLSIFPMGSLTPRERLSQAIAEWETRRELQELAQLVGVTPGAVSKWKSGSVAPPMERLAQLCAALGLSSDDVLGLDRHQIADARVARAERECDQLRNQLELAHAELRAISRRALAAVAKMERSSNSLRQMVPGRS